MTDYPILVERYTGSQAVTIVCHECGTEAVIHPDDIRSEDDYPCPRNVGAPIVRWDERHKLPCPKGHASMKYQEADHKCGGCGALGFFDEALEYCCSRACMFQARWLRERATA